MIIDFLQILFSLYVAGKWLKYFIGYSIKKFEERSVRQFKLTLPVIYRPINIIFANLLLMINLFFSTDKRVYIITTGSLLLINFAQWYILTSCVGARRTQFEHYVGSLLYILFIILMYSHGTFFIKIIIGTIIICLNLI